MGPVTPDGPVTSVAIGPASPIPYIVTGLAVFAAVAVLAYVTVLTIRTVQRRRLLKQVQQSQQRALWVRQ